MVAFGPDPAVTLIFINLLRRKTAAAGVPHKLVDLIEGQPPLVAPSPDNTACC